MARGRTSALTYRSHFINFRAIPKTCELIAPVAGNCLAKSVLYQNATNRRILRFS